MDHDIVNITRAHPHEAEVLTAIAFAAKRHWGYPEHWVAQWREQLTITPESVAAQETFAARVGGQIVGFGALAMEGETLWLKDLWVLPAAMGRGVGKALFLHAREQARGRGFASFEIESDPNAAGFYERMGATRVGTHASLLDGRHRELPVYRCATAG